MDFYFYLDGHDSYDGYRRARLTWANAHPWKPSTLGQARTGLQLINPHKEFDHK